MTLFDFHLIQMRKQRASKNWTQHAFLHRAASSDLLDRLKDVKKEFQSALIYNDVEGYLNENIGSLLHPNSSVVMGGFTDFQRPSPASVFQIIYDENNWPFGESKFDLIVTHLAHHLLNNPFRTFQIIQKSLKNDGLISGCFFGEHTLDHLRNALFETESSLNMGHAPRVHPFMTMDKVAHVLNEIGYRYVVVDKSKYTVEYKDLSSLIADLRGMGETNALNQQHKVPLTRSFLKTFETHYSRTHQGLYPLTFEIIYFAGWR